VYFANRKRKGVHRALVNFLMHSIAVSTKQNNIFYASAWDWRW